MATNEFGELVDYHVQSTRAGKLGHFEYAVIGQPPFTEEILFGAGGLAGNGWIANDGAWGGNRRNDQTFYVEIRGNDGTAEGEDLTDTYTGPLPAVSEFLTEDSDGKLAAKFAMQFFLRNVSPGDPDPKNKARRTYGYLVNTPTLTAEGGSGPLPNVQEYKSFLMSVPGPVGSTIGNVDVADLEAKVWISIHGSVPAPDPGPTRRPSVAIHIDNLTGPGVEWGISEFYFNLANDDFILGSTLTLREMPSWYQWHRNI